MQAVRLAVGVADAIPHPPSVPAELPADLTAPAPAPVQASAPARAQTPAPGALGLAPASGERFEGPPAPGGAAPSGAGPGLRGRGGWLSGLLRRPAAYVRAYLTASVEHQLQMQAGRAADLWGASGRLERRAEQLAAEAHAQAGRQDALSARLDHVSGQTERIAAHLEGVAGVLAAVSQRLAEVERRQDRLAVAVAAQAAAGNAVGADQLALARRIAAAGDHAVARLDQVLGVLGPRFDELEVKIRPLIEVDDQSTAVRTADGYVMLPRSEPLFVTAVANATSGGLEPGTRRVLRALLRPGDACADVGANVGLLTVAMAFAVGPLGRVWAFEPEARVRAQLERTLHLNGLRQVALSGAAVGAQAGRLTFNQSPVIGHSSLYPLPDDEQAQARPVEVEVVRLDDVVPPGLALAAVKIDVEGAELDVLRGLARVAADSPDLAVVAEFGPSHLARVGVSPADWFAAFAGHGLEPRLIAEPSGLVSSVTVADLAEVESANLVFVRAGGAADGRLPR